METTFGELPATIKNTKWIKPEMECTIVSSAQKTTIGKLMSQVGETPMMSQSLSPASESDTAQMVNYLGRIHYWVRFMGVVLLIYIILTIIIDLLAFMAER